MAPPTGHQPDVAQSHVKAPKQSGSGRRSAFRSLRHVGRDHAGQRFAEAYGRAGYFVVRRSQRGTTRRPARPGRTGRVGAGQAAEESTCPGSGDLGSIRITTSLRENTNETEYEGRVGRQASRG